MASMRPRTSSWEDRYNSVMGLFRDGPRSRRTVGYGSAGFQLIPNYVNRNRTISYKDTPYCGTFENDGRLFMTTARDCCLRIYDTSQSEPKLARTVSAPKAVRTILDTSFNSDENLVAYSSWSDAVHICCVDGTVDQNTPLRLNPETKPFGVFSLTFSADGNEIFCGGSDNYLYMYNLGSQIRTLRIRGHDGQINSVCAADCSSSMFFTGGDDGLVKVWDRRVIRRARARPVGFFTGHKDGVTYVDSRGDCRYVISNCKDQTIKLWDLRKFANLAGIQATLKAASSQNWDYRFQPVPADHRTNEILLPGDVSVTTYRGHIVLETLIRCRFSPMFSTGQNYVYTGCASGAIKVYDALTGKLLQTLKGHTACVRDISWHPSMPLIRSTSFDGTIKEWLYSSERKGDSSSEKDEEFHLGPLTEMGRRRQ